MCERRSDAVWRTASCAGLVCGGIVFGACAVCVCVEVAPVRTQFVSALGLLVVSERHGENRAQRS